MWHTTIRNSNDLYLVSVSIKDLALPVLKNTQPESVKVRLTPSKALICIKMETALILVAEILENLCAQSLVLTRLSGAKSMKLDVSCVSLTRCSTLYSSQQGFLTLPENGDAPF